MWDDIDWGFGDGGSADWMSGTSDSVWGSLGDSSNDYDFLDTTGNNSGSGFSWGSLFGGGSGDSGSGSNIWGQMLAGAISGAGAQGAASDANKQKGAFDIMNTQEQAKQARQTASFVAELKDYYDQKGKAVKRNALDTYGQFSLTDRYAPNMAKVAPVAVPAKPTLA